MPFQVNLKKRDFVRGRMRRNPKIGGRTRGKARSHFEFVFSNPRLRFADIQQRQQESTTGVCITTYLIR